MHDDDPAGFELDLVERPRKNHARLRQRIRGLAHRKNTGVIDRDRLRRLIDVGLVIADAEHSDCKADEVDLAIDRRLRVTARDEYTTADLFCSPSCRVLDRRPRAVIARRRRVVEHLEHDVDRLIAATACSAAAAKTIQGKGDLFIARALE